MKPQESMWQDEIDNPWLLLLYAAALTAGAAASAVWPWGVA